MLGCRLDMQACWELGAVQRGVPARASQPSSSCRFPAVTLPRCIPMSHHDPALPPAPPAVAQTAASAARWRWRSRLWRRSTTWATCGARCAVLWFDAQHEQLWGHAVQWPAAAAPAGRQQHMPSKCAAGHACTSPSPPTDPLTGRQLPPPLPPPPSLQRPCHAHPGCGLRPAAQEQRRHPGLCPALSVPHPYILSTLSSSSSSRSFIPGRQAGSSAPRRH